MSRDDRGPRGWYDERWLLALAMAAYAALWSWLCSLRYLSAYRGDPDYALFDQSFFTTLRFGTPFVNTFEGHSSFGQHVSPIFYALLPFYAIHPGIGALVVIQSVLLGLAAWPLYLIARDRLGSRTALIVAALYLLYHPLHGVNYDQFNQNSLAVLPLMSALYFFQRRRWGRFWMAAALALACKEDVSFVIAFWGLFTLAAAARQWAPGASGSASRWLALNGLAMVIVGGGWLYLSLNVIVPAFRAGHDHYGYFAERYPHLGTNFTEAMSTILFDPLRVAGFLLERERIFYVLEVFLPLAYLPLRAPALLWMTIPTFAINTLSVFNMHNTADRYTAYLIPFLFGAAVLALEHLTADGRRTALRWMVSVTILCTLLLNNTPMRIGVGRPRITDHQRQVVAAARLIPPDASVSTQVGLYSQVSQRVHAYSGYRPGTDYIFVDDTSRWYREQARWDEVLPRVLATGQYAPIYDADGITLYVRRSGGN